MIIIETLNSKLPGPKMLWGLPRGESESQSDAMDEDDVSVKGLETEWSW